MNTILNEIILATNNQHKVKEFQQLFEGKVRFKTLKEIGFTDEIIEDGSTFIENSLIKCRAVYEKTKSPVMADDSGIAVEALGGAPGILSARYGGEGLDDRGRYLYLLDNLKGESNLNASFVCALVLYINPNRIFIAQEETKGLIVFKPLGENGFGYDPIFYLPEQGRTAAELTDDEKHAVSHRGKAAGVMKEMLKSLG